VSPRNRPDLRKRSSRFQVGDLLALVDAALFGPIGRPENHLPPGLLRGARRNRTSDLSIIRTALTPQYTPPGHHIYPGEKTIGGVPRSGGLRGAILGVLS
jgi:hypothetical protein